jgi:hypothetical protein
MKFLFPFIASILFFASCGVQETVSPPPETYTLKQNYPNPFTDTTRVDYGVPFAGQGVAGPWLRLAVYDRLQQRQAVLMEKQNHPAGSTFTVVWNGRGVNGAIVPAGLYYIELQQINGSQSSSESNLTVLIRRVAVKQ